MAQAQKKIAASPAQDKGATAQAMTDTAQRKASTQVGAAVQARQQAVRSLKPSNLKALVAHAPAAEEIASIAADCGVPAPDLDAIDATARNNLVNLASLCSGDEPSRSMRILMDRTVGAAFAHACAQVERAGAAERQAREFFTRSLNGDRDDDRAPIWGIDHAPDGEDNPGYGMDDRGEKLAFIADIRRLEVAVYVRLVATMAETYEDLTGEAWKPYVGNNQGGTVAQRSTEARINRARRYGSAP